MKILCITKKIYPNLDASSACVYNLLKGLDVDYVTFESAEDIDENLIPKNVHMIPTTIGKIYKVASKIFKNKKIVSFIIKVAIRLGLYKKYNHDSTSGCFNKNDFMDIIDRLMVENEYDYLLTVSMPWICQIMGSWVKEKYTDIRWISYEVDPFVYNLNDNNFDVKKRIDEANTVYKKLDKLFYMPGIKQYNEKMGYFAPYHDKSFELNLPKLEGKALILDESFFKKDKINIVYTGIFYPGIRNPEKLFKVVDKIECDYSLHIFGSGCNKILNKYKDILGDKLVLHGYSSNETCIKAISNADILIALGNTVENQIPSKIFDYFATGKPIINITQIENDSSKKYMNQYGNAINISEDAIDSELLNNFIKNRKDITFEEVANRLDDCLIDNIRQKFVDELVNN